MAQKTTQTPCYEEGLKAASTVSVKAVNPYCSVHQPTLARDWQEGFYAGVAGRTAQIPQKKIEISIHVEVPNFQPVDKKLTVEIPNETPKTDSNPKNKEFSVEEFVRGLDRRYQKEDIAEILHVFTGWSLKECRSLVHQIL